MRYSYEGVNFDQTREPERPEAGIDYDDDYTIEYIDNSLTDDNSDPSQFSLPQSESNSPPSDNNGDNQSNTESINFSTEF